MNELINLFIVYLFIIYLLFIYIHSLLFYLIKKYVFSLHIYGSITTLIHVIAFFKYAHYLHYLKYNNEIYIFQCTKLSSQNMCYQNLKNHVFFATGEEADQLEGMQFLGVCAISIDIKLKLMKKSDHPINFLQDTLWQSVKVLNIFHYWSTSI